MASTTDLRPMKQRVATIANVLDATGAIDTLDATSPPVWSSADPTIVDVIPAADGLSATVGSFDTLGTVVVSVDADGRQGADVFPIHFEFIVSVVAEPDADAVSFDVEFADETDRA